MKPIIGIAASILLLASWAGAVRADPPGQPAPGGAGQPAPGAAQGDKDQEPEAAPPAEPASATGLKIGATADIYWENNFDNPFTHLNAGRNLDIYDAGGPHLSYAGITIEKPRAPWGFRFDPGFGKATQLFNAGETVTGAGGEVLQHIQQAYVSVNLNHKGTTYLDAGKWYSPIGFEGFLASGNWNYSNSFLDTFGSPFFHTGVRVFRYFTPTDYLMVHVSRGWSRVGGLPGSQVPGFGLVGSKQFKKLTATLNLYESEEPDLASTQSATREIGDVVLNYTASPKWLLAMDTTAWRQSNFLVTAGTVRRDVHFAGVAGYARRLLTKNDAVTFRAEVDDDAQGAAGSGAAQLLWEPTLTFEHRVNKYALAKVEYRHDQSDVATFPTAIPGRNVQHQDTIGIALILTR